MSILATLGFFIVSLIIPNNKLFFVLSILYVLIQLFINKSFVITVLQVFVPLSVYKIGLTYSFTAIPKMIIFSDNYPSGRILNVIFSPYLILLLTTVVFFIFYLFWKKRNIFNLELVFLLSTIIFMFLSSTKSIYFPIQSTIYTLSWLGLACLIILVGSQLQTFTNKKKLRILVTVFIQIGLSILFISGISLTQLIKRSPIGLNIESVSSAPSFGGGADESNLIFRPLGLSKHANIMANEIFSLWLSFFIIYLHIFKNYRKKLLKSLFLVATLSFVITTIISQSRALYITLIIFFLLLLICDYKLITAALKNSLELLKKLNKNTKTIFLMFSLILVAIFVQRAAISLNSFSETGGFPIRKKLNQEAIHLFYKHPFLGVGNGMFMPALAQNNPFGVVSQFPESVHNGFLLFSVENGLIAQLLILIFFFFLTKRVTKMSKQANLIKKITLLSLFVQFLPMFFHPFINYITICTVIIVVIDYNENISFKNAKKC